MIQGRDAKFVIVVSYMTGVILFTQYVVDKET